MRVQYLLITVLLIILMVFTGCLQPAQVVPKLADLPVPHHLIAKTGDKKARLEWQIDGEIDAYVLGYNVYIDTKSLIKAELKDLPHPFTWPPPMFVNSDTINGWTHYDLENLKNGKKYYVHIRLKGANSRISLPSNEVVIAPHPEGKITLHETKSKNYSAFDFSRLKMVASRNKKADIVFDIVDKETLLRSPHLRKKGLRQTRFWVVKGDDLSDITGNAEYSEEVALSEGQVIIAETEEGNYARLVIEKLGGKAPDRYVVMSYAYQTIENLLLF